MSNLRGAARLFGGRVIGRVVLLCVLAELCLWQLLAPLPIWPLSLLARLNHWLVVLLALALPAAAFAAAMAMVVRDVIRPLRALAGYVADQNAHAITEPPATLRCRGDEIGRIARGIAALCGALKARHDTLLEQTLNDPLTGLGNRRLLEQRLETLLPLSRRHNTSISALMIDVDHFKAYNDYYGHLAGDDCLIELANVLRDTFRRETDIIVRLGGEEFLVVLVDVNGEDAVQLAEAMRSMLQFTGIPHARSPTAATVTVSIGVATTEAGMPIDLDTLVACADACLYECKSQGRNRSAHRVIGARQIHRPARDVAEEIFQSSVAKAAGRNRRRHGPPVVRR